jgi:hypothetical protein
VLFLCLVLAAPAVVLATHPVSSEDYSLLGFTADGKYVYFQRDDMDPSSEQQDVWLRVVDAKSGKRVKTALVYRQCLEGEDGEQECYKGRPISKKLSARYRAKVYAKFGKPDGGQAAKRSGGSDASKVQELMMTTGGFVQTWKVGQATITTTLWHRGELPLAYEERPTVVTLQVEKVGPLGKAVGKTRVAIHPIARGWSNDIAWRGLVLGSLQLGPQGESVALVLANRPVLVSLAPVVDTEQRR